MINLNDYIETYKKELENGIIQKAYTGLLKYVMNLKIYLEKDLSDKYSFGNISLGYMDFTYFPFSNDFLREQKLRFGIVLNHQKVQFELWLMGRNASVQKEYWNILKNTKWNENQLAMPKYSILEVILVENPDFNNLDFLNQLIMKEAIHHVEEINDYLRNRNIINKT